MGYYAVRPIEGLRLICLNSVIFNHHFFAVDGSNQLQDGNTQLGWLGQQLALAKKARERVYIAMHIPPGNDAYGTEPMWTETANGNGTRWLTQFLTLVAQYQSTISGILYGHTHMDEVRRLYAPNSNQITAVAISCPGVTPYHKNNPGFKTVRYHPLSKQLLDFTTYYTTPGANGWGNGTYTFSGTYPGSGATIYQRLTQQGWSADIVAAYMANIYKVGNGQGNVGTIQKGIDVRASGNQGRNP
jgi:sphingomyelin phosphodiesterase acid-like 3